MNPRDLIPKIDQIKFVRGVESDLLQRRRKGMLGAVIAMVAAVSQVALAAQQTNYAQNLGDALTALFKGDFANVFSSVSGPQLIGILIIVAGTLIYLTYRWTSVLLQESKEPFQYTFWIDPFELVKGTPSKRFALEADDRLQLLHHDLMERLSLNIRRLSLLNVDVDVPEEARNNLTSHIRIRGNYAIREVEDGRWVLHVMPVIRIGPAGRAEIVAEPVKIDLREGASDSKKQLSAKTYNHLVQRIYSIVASQVYKQILSDVKTKSNLFPTHYLKAVALYHEAVDFERSNTIDAYDSAIELYRQSIRLFETRALAWFRDRLVKTPVFPLWKRGKTSLLANARMRIGLARSLIYRRMVSALSGRNQNVLFEIPAELNRVIDNLTILQYRITPKKWALPRTPEPGRSESSLLDLANIADVAAKNEIGWDEESSALPSFDLSRPQSDPSAQQDYRALMTFLTFRGGVDLRRSFEEQRATLFDAYAVTALAHSYLDAPNIASELLKRAKATNPILSQRSPILFLATAEVEPNIDKKLLFLTQAAELDPKFEIAQYRLAQFSEMRMRSRGEIRKERVSGVIKQYEDVLTMNPGNIGALSAQGYLWWVLGDREAARRKLEEGCQNRAIVRQTFVGDLFYGLARIAAEDGQFNRCYDLYSQAISADPEVACHSMVSSRKVLQSNYDYIDRSLLRRYEAFYRRTSRAIEKLLALTEKERLDEDNLVVSERILKSVRSYVVNDYGNACLNYFLRFGEPQQLRNAIKAYDAATRDNEENFVAYYNLNTAYTWMETLPLESRDLLDNAEKIAPAWPALLIASVAARVERAQERINKHKRELEALEKQLIDKAGEVVEEFSQRSMAEQSYSPATENEDPPIIPSQNEASVTLAERKEPRKEVEVLQNYKKLELKMAGLQRDIEEAQKTLKKKIFPQITSKTMSRTKWSSLLSGLKLDYDGHGVNELLEAGIEIEGLDEDDLKALQVWAKTLSTNVESESALVAAEKLCEYIQTFYPERFDTKQILYSVYGSLETVGTPLLEMRNLRDAEGILQKLLKSAKPHHKFLLGQLSISPDDLKLYSSSSLPPQALKRALLAEFNRIIKDTSLADQESFKLLKKALPTARLSLRKRTNVNRVRVNRQLLQLAFPNELRIERDISDAVIERYQAKQAECGASLRKTINDWLEGDPLNYASLKWATDFTDFFNPQMRRQALKAAIALQPENGAYYHLFGTWRDKRSFFKLAAKCHEVACEKAPKEHTYFYSLGTSYYRQKKYAEAAQVYSRAVAIAPTDQSYQNSLGNSYYGAEKFEEAAQCYQKAIDISDGVAVYHSNLALALQNLEKWESAIAACQTARKLDPQPSYETQLATLHNLQGNDYFSKTNFTAASECYREAISLAGKVAVFHSNLSRAYEEMKDWENAISACENAIKIDSSYKAQLANVYHSRGTEDFINQNYLAAKASFEEAIRRAPGTAIYHGNLGAALGGLNEWADAAREYETATTLAPDTAIYHGHLAAALSQVKNWERAKQEYEKAIALEGETPAAALLHSNFSGTLRLMKDWSRAEEEAKKAIELEPEGAAHRQRLALVYNDHGVEYFNESRHLKAIEKYNEAIATDEGNDLIHANMSLAWAELNGYDPTNDNVKKAIAALQKALDLKPDNQNYRDRMAQLQARQTSQAPETSQASQTRPD